MENGKVELNIGLISHILILRVCWPVITYIWHHKLSVVRTKTQHNKFNLKKI